MYVFKRFHLRPITTILWKQLSEARSGSSHVRRFIITDKTYSRFEFGKSKIIRIRLSTIEKENHSSSKILTCSYMFTSKGFTRYMCSRSIYQLIFMENAKCDPWFSLLDYSEGEIRF